MPMPRQCGNALAVGLMALVLAAIGIAIGVQQRQRAERSAAIQQTVADINAIIGETKSVYGKYGYRGLTHDDAVISGVIPPSMLLANGTGSGAGQAVARHSLGGEVRLGFIDMAAGWRAGEVRFRDVPSDACLSVMTATEKLAGQASDGPYLAKWDGGPLHLVSVESGCIAADKVGLVWVFHRV